MILSNQMFLRLEALGMGEGASLFSSDNQQGQRFGTRYQRMLQVGTGSGFLTLGHILSFPQESSFSSFIK
jgi:hypothetical protein